MRSIGFGIENIGKLALRWPLPATILVLLFSLITGLGITQLSFDDAVRDAFRTSRPEFARYQTFINEFSNARADTFVLFEGDRLDRHLEALRDIAFEAQLLDNVAAAVSVFSLRAVTPDGNIGDALFPADLPDGEALESLLTGADGHPLNRGRLFSKDRRHLVLILALTREDNPEGSFSTVKADLEGLFAENLPDGVTATMTGLPAMHTAVVDELVRDVFVLNFTGLALALVIGLFTLGNIWAALITAAAPLCAVLWMLGGMGLAGVSINLMTNVLPVLILVLAFADSMHLTYEVRRYRRNDATSGRRAAYRAVTRIGPACALAAITTMVAFFTLSLSDSALIRSFGQTGIFAVLGAMFAVLVVHPLTIYWLARSGLAKSWSQPHIGRRRISLRGISANVGQLTQKWPRRIALCGVGVAILLALAHSQVRPTYSFLENIPKGARAFQALTVIESKLGGGHSIYLPVRLDRPGGALAAGNLAELVRIEQVVRKEVAPLDVVSLATFARWLEPENPQAAGPKIKALLDEIPPDARWRILSTSGQTALIVIRLADQGSKATRALIERIDKVVADATPDGAEVPKVTGHMALSAQTGAWMIGRLNYALLAAVFISILVIAFAFRSLRAGFYALIPNLLPILAAGATLYLTGRGLQFTSAIALTIAFGIAVDDTIHFLGAYRHAARHPGRGGGGVREAVLGAFERAGPALIATTAILCVGLLVTLLSNLPMVHLFGWLSALTLFVALLADMIVLPAIIGALEPRKSP